MFMIFALLLRVSGANIPEPMTITVCTAEQTTGCVTWEVAKTQIEEYDGPAITISNMKDVNTGLSPKSSFKMIGFFCMFRMHYRNHNTQCCYRHGPDILYRLP